MRYIHIFNSVATLEWAIAGAVFFALLCLLFFITLHFRSGRGHEPSKTLRHSRLELSWAVLLLCFAMGYFLYTVSKNTQERANYGTGAAALTVKVTGFQWCWRFAYEGTPVTVQGTCIGGMPTLEVPTNEVVRFDVTSSDVVHNFWLPFMDFKIAAYPNHVNTFETEFTKTGFHTGRCAEFCGLYHFRMDFHVDIVPPATFRRWLAGKEGAARRAGAVPGGGRLAGHRLAATAGAPAGGSTP